MLETRVGSYRIIEKLAQGGMGEVYVAYHDLMQREAVVKMLHPKLLHDEDVVQRFLNEARAATAIEHPGIVEIYDLGRSHGQVYIIMERLRGETLAERVAKGTLDVGLTVSLSKQLASALEAGLSEASRKEEVDSPHEGFFREAMVDAIEADNALFNDVMEAQSLDDEPSGMDDTSGSERRL